MTVELELRLHAQMPFSERPGDREREDEVARTATVRPTAAPVDPAHRFPVEAEPGREEEAPAVHAPERDRAGSAVLQRGGDRGGGHGGLRARGRARGGRRSRHRRARSRTVFEAAGAVDGLVVGSVAGVDDDRVDEPRPLPRARSRGPGPSVCDERRPPRASAASTLSTSGAARRRVAGSRSGRWLARRRQANQVSRSRASRRAARRRAVGELVGAHGPAAATCRPSSPPRGRGAPRSRRRGRCGARPAPRPRGRARGRAPRSAAARRRSVPRRSPSSARHSRVKTVAASSCSATTRRWARSASRIFSVAAAPRDRRRVRRGTPRRPSLRDLPEEIFLRVDVVVERRLLDPERLGEVGERRAVVAALGEEPGRGTRQLLTPCGHRCASLPIGRVIDRPKQSSSSICTGRPGRGRRLDARRVPAAARQVHPDARQLRADGRAARAGVDPARADAPAQARPHGQGARRGRACPVDLPRRRGPRQAARAVPRGARRGRGEVPQRLPLPDEDAGATSA